MKRTGKQIILDTFHLVKKDLKENRIALLAILFYFLCSKMIFHTICPMVLFTGLPCPACGLTRAGIALLTGKFALAWQMHPFIYLIVLLCVIWAIQRYVLQRTLPWMKVVWVVSLCALIAFYFYRMFRYFPDQPPMSYYHRNLLVFFYELVVR
ncbi:MAG: DUF2752 domain-containing protein [Hespellia sp.]|nr:DUF2752 domain-containing protein [Hespellia sp.]